MFSSLNSDSCYWLGFTYGDGSVSKYSLRFELSNKDIDHLYKIKTFFETDAPVLKSEKNCSRININSKDFCDKIQKIGIVVNKTYRKEIPNIPEKYYNDFIRGILDSDGWIVKHNNRFNIPQYEFGFSSNNKHLLEKIQDHLCVKLEKSKLGSLRQTKSCYQLIIGGNKQFKSIYKLLYVNSKDSNRLSRKYNLATEAIKYIEKRPDKRSLKNLQTPDIVTKSDRYGP